MKRTIAIVALFCVASSWAQQKAGSKFTLKLDPYSITVLAM